MERKSLDIPFKSLSSPTLHMKSEHRQLEVRKKETGEQNPLGMPWEVKHESH